MTGGSRGRGREPGETANLSSVDMMFELRSKLVSEAVLTCAGFAGPTYLFDPGVVGTKFERKIWFLVRGKYDADRRTAKSTGRFGTSAWSNDKFLPKKIVFHSLYLQISSKLHFYECIRYVQSNNFTRRYQHPKSK